MVDRARAKVLVIDDDAAFGQMVAEALVERGFDATWVESPAAALRRLEADTWAVIVVDLEMPEMGGLELVERARALSPDTQAIILTGRGDIDSAVEGVRKGIADYLQKGQLKIEKLWQSVEDAADRFQLLRHNRELVAALDDSNRLLRALHQSSASINAEQHLDRLLERVVAAARETCGASSAKVMLLDRSHTGELIIGTVVGDSQETLRGARLRPGEGIVPLAIERDDTILLQHPRSHSRYSARCDAVTATQPGFLCAPLRHGKVLGALVVAGSGRGSFGSPEQGALAILARQASVAIDNVLHQEQAVNFFTHTSSILVEFLEAMDVGYPGHSHGVAALSDMVSRRLGLGDAERRNIHFAALLHDIGKVRLDRSFFALEEAGPLSQEGRRLMQMHPALGMEVLRPITLWEDLLAIIHAHHERWDGQGYPRGLVGEEIPLGARVVAVADAFDAIARDTPYQRARHPEGLLAELEAGAGTQFDPRIVRLFVAEYRQHGDPRGLAQ